MSVRRRSRGGGDFDLDVDEIEAIVRLCDHPECALIGMYPAPRGRNRLRDYYWFCLEHVRAYNAAWNYYAGMSEAEIEAEIRRDTVWRRPTWRLGGPRTDDPLDPFELFGEGAQGKFEESKPRQRFATPAAEALVIMGLEPPVTAAEVKSRYKTLVKLHHPDANGGDKAAEERLKVINRAYATLMQVALP